MQGPHLREKGLRGRGEKMAKGRERVVSGEAYEVKTFGGLLTGEPLFLSAESKKAEGDLQGEEFVRFLVGGLRGQ